MQQTKIQDIVVSLDETSVELRSTRLLGSRAISLNRDGAQQLSEFLQEQFADQSDRRESFRVPVFAFSGVRVTLHLSGGDLEVVPRNIGYTGIFVDIDEDIDPGLQAGMTVPVTLATNDDAIQLRALVRRRVGNGYGLFLIDSIRDENLSPPALIVEIMHDMRQREKHVAGVD